MMTTYLMTPSHLLTSAALSVFLSVSPSPGGADTMVKLHSNACARGLIAVMGDTPELVGTDSELDFVEVSFGRMCQTFAAMCQPYVSNI